MQTPADPARRAQAAARQAVAQVTAPPHERRRRARLFKLGLLALIAAFAALMFLAGQYPYFQLDLRITRAIQVETNPAFAAIMAWISWFGYAPQALALPVLAAALLALLGLRWAGGMALAAAVGVGLLNTAVKIVVNRPRPTADLVQVAHVLDSYSFPSGHVMFYTCFLGYLFFLVFTRLKHTRLRTLLLTLLAAPVLLVGVSRIYLGEHWASDVLGGYLLGSLALIAVVIVYRRGRRLWVSPFSTRFRKSRTS